MNPIIAITMGDPAGVGPEVIAKMIADLKSPVGFTPFVIGSSSVMRDTVKQLGLALDVLCIDQPYVKFHQGVLPVLELPDIEKGAFSIGSVNPWCGEVSFQSVVTAVNLCLSDQVDAVVTAPISKEAWHTAGHRFDGHTGLLAELTKCDDYRMTFASDKLNVMLSTTHISLCQVCEMLSIDRIYETIMLGDRFLRDLGILEPKIAVCGINPHAGESGIFGDEDERMVKPAIHKSAAEGIAVVGPLPSDTIFLRAVRGEFDLVVAQYHDQGLIPIKLVAFDTAVNISVGLPIIRTSVDHGTAFDIAGRGIADHRNMRSAIDYAVKLAGDCAKRTAR